MKIFLGNSDFEFLLIDANKHEFCLVNSTHNQEKSTPLTLNNEFKSFVMNGFGAKTENKPECFKKEHEFKTNDELALILNLKKKFNNLNYGKLTLNVISALTDKSLKKKQEAKAKIEAALNIDTKL